MLPAEAREHTRTCTVSDCNVRKPEVREMHIMHFLLPVVSPEVPMELIRLLIEDILFCNQLAFSARLQPEV